MPKMLAAWAAALSLSFTAPAFADDYSWASSDYNYASRQLDNFITNFQTDLVDPTVQRMRRAKAADANRPPALPRTTKAPAAPAGPILFTPVRVPAAQSTARRMAAAYPKEAQTQAEALFSQLLTSYAELERMNGVPHGDIGAAVAFFLGGNWMAMNNSDLSDAKFAPIIAQMRTVLASSPQFSSLPNLQKQEIYEQMVIQGMFMATTQMALRTKNDPAMVTKMKTAGRANLTNWFGADATALRVTANGLEL